MAPDTSCHTSHHAVADLLDLVLSVCGAGVDSTSCLTMLADPGAFKWTVHVTQAGMSHL